MYHCWGPFLCTAFLLTHPQSEHGTFLTACTSASSEQWCQRLPSSSIPKRGRLGEVAEGFFRAFLWDTTLEQSTPDAAQAPGSHRCETLVQRRFFRMLKEKPSPSSKTCPSEISSKTTPLPLYSPPHLQTPPIAPKLVQRQWHRVALPTSHIHRLQGCPDPELRMTAWIPVELVQPEEGEKRLENRRECKVQQGQGWVESHPQAALVHHLCGCSALWGRCCSAPFCFHEPQGSCDSAVSRWSGSGVQDTVLWAPCGERQHLPTPSRLAPVFPLPRKQGKTKHLLLPPTLSSA